MKVTIFLEYPSVELAHIVSQALSTDKELRPEKITRTFSVIDSEKKLKV